MGLVIYGGVAVSVFHDEDCNDKAYQGDNGMVCMGETLDLELTILLIEVL